MAEAEMFQECIFDAVCNGEIVAESLTMDISGAITDAVFAAHIIWPWAERELSSPEPWYGYDASGNEITVPSAPEDAPPPESVSENTRLLIAGLSRLLAVRAGSAYMHGDNISASALARAAEKAVLPGLPPDASKT